MGINMTTSKNNNNYYYCYHCCTYFGVAEAVDPVRGPVPLPEEAAGLLLGPYPALVVGLDSLERLLYRLLEPVIPKLVDVLL